MSIQNLVGKTVTLELVGVDGNAFSIVGAVTRQMRKEGWTKEEIDIARDQMMAGDYNHLLATAMTYCSSPIRGERVDEFTVAFDQADVESALLDDDDDSDGEDFWASEQEED